MYDFDSIIDRRSSNSVKWSGLSLRQLYGRSDLKPFWIADMDFAVAPAIQTAVMEKAKHGIYGYSHGDSHVHAFIDWVKRRFNWKVRAEWIQHTPGVVTALNLAVNAFCEPGDQVMIQEPVYYPFANAIRNNGCHVLSNDLVIKNGAYEIDFADFAEKARRPDTRMFILCSPHNPIGRLWTREELARMMEICKENNVIVVADEIHCDLVLHGSRHQVVAELDRAYHRHLVTCMAPSKTFNLAGLQMSFIVIEDAELRRRFARQIQKNGLGMPNAFAIEAVTAAYNESEDWLEELLDYLADNAAFVRGFCREYLSRVRFFKHEATYLMWLDFRDYGLKDLDLQTLIFHQAKIAMDAGVWFGHCGEGFMRLNIAAPRAVLEDALRDLAAVFKERGMGPDQPETAMGNL